MAQLIQIELILNIPNVCQPSLASMFQVVIVHLFIGYIYLADRVPHRFLPFQIGTVPIYNPPYKLFRAVGLEASSKKLKSNN